VPIAKTVETLIKEMPNTSNSMVTTLGEFIFKRFGVDIPASAWPDKDLPDHLKMRVAITDPDGKKLRCSRDKSILKKDLPEMANWDIKQSDEYEPAKKKWEKSCLTGWDFPDIQEEILLTGKANTKCTFYPGLEQDKKSSKTVNLRLFRSKDQATTSHKKGVAALYGLIFSTELKFLKKNLRISNDVANYPKYFGGIKIFEKRLYDKVTTDLFSINIKTKKAFDSHAEKTAPVIQKKGLDLLKKTEIVLKTYHETRTILHNLHMANKENQTATMFLDDLCKQLERVVPETFAALYHTSRLDHIIRYIKAIALRGQRGLSDFKKDQDRAIELKKFNQSLNELVKGLNLRTSEEKREAIEEFFWLIEEYKVSIFAQELKTPFPVSKKRLDKKLNEIKRMV
jgi:ATP-dependent helicase HrpA